MRHPTLKEGFALPASLLAIVVIGALVTGGVYTAMSEDRSSVNSLHGNHAFLAAERGLQDLLGTKTRPYFENDVGPVGAADTIGPVAVTIDGVDAEYTLYVQRLATRLFKVDSEGVITGGGRYAGSTRRLSEVMRIVFTSVPMDRALTTQEGLRIRGQSLVSGVDVQPTGWTECSDVGTQTGVLALDEASIDIPKGGTNNGVTGDPAIREDATLDSLDFIEYGDMHLDDLKAMANITLPPGTYTGMAPSSTNGVCNETDQMNWGDPNDPSGPCHYYWPIIYSPGDLHLSTGVGQGILIVDGDLIVAGNFEFSGLVFVYGSISFRGNGNKFSGSVTVLGNNGISEVGETDGTGTGVGDTKVHLSSCAIERAHLYNDRFARPIPLAERSFVDISGLGLD